MTGLRAGDVARSAGVNRQTLLYYERRGLLPVPQRSNGGHRLYDAETVTVLRVIKSAQRLGFTLDEVADLLEVGRHHHGGRGPGLHEAARAKLQEVETRIADLELIRDTLRSAVVAGCDDLVDCSGDPACPIPFQEIATAERPRPAG